MKVLLIFTLISVAVFSCKEKDEPVILADLAGTQWRSDESTDKGYYYTELSFTGDTVTILNMSQKKSALSERHVYMKIYQRFFMLNKDGSLTIGEISGDKINFRNKDFKLKK